MALNPAEQFNFEQNAIHGDWTQDEVDARKNALTLTDSGNEQVAHVEMLEAKNSDSSDELGELAEPSLQNPGNEQVAHVEVLEAKTNDASKKLGQFAERTLQIQDSAIYGKMDQEQVDRMLANK